MSAVSVTLDRTSLNLAPLVITGTQVREGLYISKTGYVEPDFEPRYTYAPESAYYGGARLLAAVPAGGSWPLGLTISAATEAARTALRAQVDQAATQFLYTLTITRNGQSRLYDADYSIPKWDAGGSDQMNAGLLRGSLVIPINPKGT